MDHIRLSPRLQMVADFVPPCTCAADIGTDHGYLPVWLLQNGIAETAIAADIHAGPLANARQSADDYDLTERFRFVLADGLQFPDAQDADIITVAGMGGETICSIMAAAPWLLKGYRLVLQPQSKVTELTDWLWRSGFTIAVTVASAILRCMCLAGRASSRARWSSFYSGAQIRCCQNT